MAGFRKGTSTALASYVRREQFSLLAVGKESASRVQVCLQNGIDAIECSNTTRALTLLESQAYDVLLCDLPQANLDTMAFMQAVQKTSTNAAIVFTIEPNDLRLALLAMIEGASGFILRSDSAAEFLRQIMAIWVKSVLLSPLKNALHSSGK